MQLIQQAPKAMPITLFRGRDLPSVAGSEYVAHEPPEGRLTVPNPCFPRQPLPNMGSADTSMLCEGFPKA
jgi:hypothetical protein